MSITDLPVELLSKVCSHLQPSEWQELRLSCRTLYKSSFAEFTACFFERIHFIVTSDSLGELEALARIDGIRERVHELWMIPSVFDGSHAADEHAISEFAVSSKSCQSVSGEELKARFSTYKALVADNSSLLESETFSTRLRGCLGKFDNLDTIGLAHYSTSFLLDPRQEKVRFLGWRRLINQIDFRFGSKNLQPLHGSGSVMGKVNSLAASRLLQALNGSNCRIRKLQTCNPDYCGNIGPEILLAEEQYSSVLSALDDLEDLHVCTAFRTTKPVHIMDTNTPTWVTMLIHVAARLERLTISQDYFFGELSSKIQFDSLKELHLHKTWINSEDLKSFLMKAKKTLTFFTLFEVIMEGISPLSLPDHSSLWYSPTPKWLLHSSIPPSTTSTSTAYIPTSSTYTPTSSAYNPTSPYSPTSTAFTPTPIANTSVSTPYYAQPARQVLPRQDYTPSALYIPPTDHEDALWKSIWNFFGENLSLQRFSIAKVADGTRQISIQRTDGLIKPSENAIFDAETAGMSFHQWIDQFTPMHLLDSPSPTVWPDNDQKAWFNRMMHANSSSVSPAMCDCENAARGCDFGCEYEKLIL
ncbi:uncharacterized protein N7503_008439 [Penicillium pulvis]|uniref:uncharacterized protein n=1 Tax=Penicillium pulvis TaxID=1562058 RepID=UPI002547A67F|nr:uncharacterized protein N7503_008439 [Penicillium pulvis]KAJ5792461.1 hypothetical protein N7503_008439 [Penicillium pulvis]